MANFVFDGSQNLTITNFNTISDAVNFINVNAANVRSFENVNGSATLTLNNGRVLVFQNVPLGNLTTGNLVAASASDLQFRIGTAGADTGAAQAGNVVVGFEGADSQFGLSNGAIVYGNSGNDTITGTGDPDGAGPAVSATFTGLRIYGGQGNDTITGFGTGSVVYGGLNTLGIDSITAGTVAPGGGVTIYGGNGFADAGDGDDAIVGSAGNDLIYGNGGNDTITATGGGADSIYGGQGNDGITLAAGSGGSIVYGGLNNDIINAGAVTGTGVTIYGGNGLVDTMDGADTITGSVNADLIYGNAGNDTITTGGDRDSIFGGSGNDTIGGAGAAGTVGSGAIVYGGNGSDTITLTGAANTTNVTIFGGNGLSDAEDGSDTITFSGVGSVLAYGNGGTDAITTADGNDTIFGGAGSDTINAGLGRNVVTGGEGADVFVATTTPSNTNFTTVTDFGAGDTIRFTEAVRGITQLSIDNTINDVAEFIAATAAAANNNIDGQAFQFTFTAGDMAGQTIVGLNNNGAGGVDEVIVLTGTVATLNGSAFTVG